MNYHDRDRLGVSILLAALLHGLLFLLAALLPWGDIRPFPESRPLILVELQEFTLPAAKEPPAPSPPDRETPGRQAPEKPAPAETGKPLSMTALRETSPRVPPAPRPPVVTPKPEPRPPARVPEKPGPEARTPPEVVKTPAMVEPPSPDGGIPLSGRASSFLAGPPRRDEALEADRRLLEDQRRGLEKWLRENPVQAPVPGEEPDRAASPAQTAPDPAAETRRQFEGELARVEAAIAELQRGRGREGTAAGPGPEAAPRQTPIRDRQGREIGVGVLEGRNPRGGLPLVLSKSDFGGEPPPETRIFAEFDILESGIMDPASLKISGDTRYTNAAEKIRTALRSWGFSPLPGVRTRARIVIVIKSSDVR